MRRKAAKQRGTDADIGVGTLEGILHLRGDAEAPRDENVQLLRVAYTMLYAMLHFLAIE